MVGGTEFLDGAVTFWFLATELFSHITLEITIRLTMKVSCVVYVLGCRESRGSQSSALCTSHTVSGELVNEKSKVTPV
jgi:hypothetical protein